MKIARLELRNYRGFHLLDVELSTDLTVFVGNNGVGKSSILEAIVVYLSWLVARIKYGDKGKGSGIKQESIRNGATNSSILVWHIAQSSEYKTLIAKNRIGVKSTEKHFSILNYVSRLADVYRTQLTNDNNASLPLLAYYPVERSILEIVIDIKYNHSFEQIDGYENSLAKGSSFSSFFEWFRYREDIENQENMHPSTYKKLLNLLDDSIKTEIEKKLSAIQIENSDSQLAAVRNAIAVFMPEYKNLHVDREHRGLGKMLVEKDGKEFDISQLSQGEKSLMALVGDIARRLSMMNPSLKNPLHGEGIVLIDEVDLHLHPKWQQTVVQDLLRTFPNIQFILTTHSPQVLSTVERKNIRVLYQTTKGLNEVLLPTLEIKGIESAIALNDVMGVNPIPPVQEAKWIADYIAKIENGTYEDDEGKDLREKLLAFYGLQHPVILDADKLIRFQAFKLRKKTTSET